MPSQVETIFCALGNRTLRLLATIHQVSVLITDIFYWTFVAPLKTRKIRAKTTVSEMVKIGYNSVPIIAVISFFVGMILALQSAYQLKKVGALIYIANLVGVSITRELGPIMTAILIAGRSGSSFAAEIGSMKVAEEIDALRGMGINPISFIISPKLVAMLVMAPCLTILADFIAITGGAVLAITAVGIHPLSYIEQTTKAIALNDVFTGLVKSIAFGAIITVVGAYQGLQVQGSAEDVGYCTTKAVVVSIFTVILFDLFFTILFYFFA